MSNLFDNLSLCVVLHAVLDDVEHAVLNDLCTLYIVPLYILYAGSGLESEAQAVRSLVARVRSIDDVCFVRVEHRSGVVIEAYQVILAAEHIAVSRSSNSIVHTLQAVGCLIIGYGVCFGR